MSHFVVGISIESLNGQRTCRHINGEGSPIELNKEYFTNHQIYRNITPVEVDGQHMISIPAFFVRSDLVSKGDSAEHRYLISPEPAEGFHVHPAFMRYGKLVPRILVGAYEGSLGENGEICSLPGKQPAGGRDFFDMRAACLARNSDAAQGWCMQNIRMLAAIQRLMIIEAGNTDSQEVFGRGNVDGNGMKPTGESGLNWRGLRDLWGNSITMIDGVLFGENHVIHIEDSQGFGELINTGTKATNSRINGYPSRFAFASGQRFDLSDVFLPVENVEEPEDAIAPDRIWGSWDDANNVLYAGGNWMNGSGAGLFYLRFFNAPSNSDTSLGVRLAKYDF